MSGIRRAAWLGTRLAFVFTVPYLALYGVNQRTDPPEFGLPPWVILVFAQVFALGFLFAASAICQRVTRCAQSLRWIPLAYAVILAVAFPVAAAGYRQFQPTKELPPTKLLPSVVDILLVQPPRSAFGAPREAPRLSEAPPEVERWDVRFAVASAAPGARPSLKLHLPATRRAKAFNALLAAQKATATARRRLPGVRGALLDWRENAAHAIVLNVDGIHARALDGTSTASMPADWEPFVRRTARSTPVYAILGETDDERLLAWQKWTEERGGEAVRFRDTGRPLLIDAAVRIATEKAGNFADEALAWRFRPKLFFDSLEPLPNPVDVDKFLRSPRVKLDRKKGLSFDLRKLESDELPGAIYYHVVRDKEHPGTVYLDYWWYFPYNPTPVGRDALCEPGFMIPNVTCFDHESDWEGITVVLEEMKDAFVPQHVVYAQHEFGAAFGWGDLISRWDSADLLDGDRPVVYVAASSHASYPLPCVKSCVQVHNPKVRKEGTHDGRVGWKKNFNGPCDGTCLKRLPETRTGDPALWNASPLPWGASNCIFKIYCDRGAAPLAPRYQGRFAAPWKPLDAGKPTVYAPGYAGLQVEYAKYD